MIRAFTELPEDLLIGILFSGYLGFDWLEVREYALVNKSLFQLARCSVCKVTVPADEFSSYCQNIANILSQTIYFDLSDINSYTPETSSTIAKWSHSLKSLVLRGVNVVDDDIRTIMQNIESSWPNNTLTLMSLDLSKGKIADRPHISDAAIEYFITSSAFDGSALRWLNLSMTNISDYGIILIASSFPKLELLGIQCCPRLSNGGLEPLTALSLSFLDFSGCKGLTGGVIEILFNGNRSNVLTQSLVVLSCAHLLNFNNRHLSSILLCCKNLKRLDCRPRDTFFQNPDAPQIDWDEVLLEKGREQLDVLALRHQDLLKVPLHEHINIVSVHPNYLHHWEHYHWPYYNSVETKLYR